jgi:hypothetical protein
LSSIEPGYAVVAGIIDFHLVLLGTYLGSPLEKRIGETNDSFSGIRTIRQRYSSFLNRAVSKIFAKSEPISSKSCPVFSKQGQPEKE